MFPLRQSDDLVFDQIFSAPCQQIQQGYSMDHDTQQRSNLTPNKAKKRSRELQAIGDGDDNDSNDNKQKRGMHKDIERRRRLEMGQLYASLRSLLPLEYIKGKRSISDHVDQAANYIKQTQENIKELEIKREKMKIFCNASVVEAGNGSSNYGMGNIVRVSSCWCGIEISISSGWNEGFPLSRLLQVLLQQNLNVVSCISTKINERLIHTILSEVSDPTCIDLSVLQQELTDIINTE